jgi:hypothetical protein
MKLNFSSLHRRSIICLNLNLFFPRIITDKFESIWLSGSDGKNYTEKWSDNGQTSSDTKNLSAFGQAS